MLTTEQLAAIRERCERATLGPWIRSGHNFYGPKHKLSQHPNNRIFLGETVSGSNRRHPHLDGGSGLDDIPGDGVCDAEFIVHAREDIPALLESNDMLRNSLTLQRNHIDLIEEDRDHYKGIFEEVIKKGAHVEADRDRWKVRGDGEGCETEL